MAWHVVAIEAQARAKKRVPSLESVMPKRLAGQPAATVDHEAMAAALKVWADVHNATVAR